MFDGDDNVVVKRSSHLEMATGFLPLDIGIWFQLRNQTTGLGKEEDMLTERIRSPLLALFLFSFLL